jgi:hypothetical protein
MIIERGSHFAFQPRRGETEVLHLEEYHFLLKTDINFARNSNGE